MPARLNEGQRESFDSGLAPAAHLDMIGALAFRAVAAGSRLGVFAALADTEATAEALADDLGLDRRGLTLLLDALAANGYLLRSETGYALSEGARRWLLPEGGFSVVAEFWSEVLAEQWDSLEDSIRTGTPAADFYGWLEERPDMRERFHAMLAGIAESLSPAAVEALGPISGHIVDVGGGHGAYATALLSANPGTEATIVDLPGALEVARARVQQAGLADRVHFVPADVTEPLDLPADTFSVALLFNMLHGFDGPANRRLLGSVHRSLRPDGRVAVVEQLAGGPPSDDLAGAFVSVFSLNLFHTQGGQAPHEDDLRGWLADAGFVDVAASPLRESAAEWLFVGSAGPRGE
ncbi:class I SAM-dependent methyltransferase [Nocardioides sp. GXZ039]|uniref:class I SAM-dependent methyltransferase n=1 Tax=Nocardioides sp. GXZ039 TaxID=3136018 RepID=UPI0030F3AB18